VRTPSSSDLLDAWAAAAALGPSARSLALLQVAEPDVQMAELAALPLGRCEEQLLELRSRLFGRTLEASITCPSCGERLELDTRPEEFVGWPADAAAATVESVREGGWLVRFRLPASHDLAAVEGRRDPDVIARALLGRCLIEASLDGGAMAVDEVPLALAQAVGRRMAELDPLPVAAVEVECAQCGHCWRAPVNLSGFVWAEVDAWAQRTLRQVHELASAYSWTEETVLALSPARRERYLQMVAG
jgi:hypothetical protein